MGAIDKRTGQGIRAFDSGEQIIALLEDYAGSLEVEGSTEPPTVTGLAKFANINRSTLWRALHKFPEVQKEFEDITADALVRGGFAGRFKNTPLVIFTLKNRCGWTDKRELVTEAKGKGTGLTQDEIDKELKALGYIRADKVVESKTDDKD